MKTLTCIWRNSLTNVQPCDKNWKSQDDRPLIDHNHENRIRSQNRHHEQLLLIKKTDYQFIQIQIITLTI